MIEVMVVVAIVGILAALAAPSFTEMLRNNRLSAASAALHTSLNLARSEAVKRGSSARVTVAANTTAGVWTNGWTVFVDLTADANAGVGLSAADDGGVKGNRLEVVGAPAGPVAAVQNGVPYFMYDGLGRIMRADGGLGMQSIWFVDGNSDRYCLVINVSGRVQAGRVANAVACA